MMLLPEEFAFLCCLRFYSLLQFGLCNGQNKSGNNNKVGCTLVCVCVPPYSRKKMAVSLENKHQLDSGCGCWCGW